MCPIVGTNMWWISYCNLLLSLTNLEDYNHQWNYALTHYCCPRPRGSCEWWALLPPAAVAAVACPGETGWRRLYRRSPPCAWTCCPARPSHRTRTTRYWASMSRLKNPWKTLILWATDGLKWHKQSISPQRDSWVLKTQTTSIWHIKWHSVHEVLSKKLRYNTNFYWILQKHEVLCNNFYSLDI